MLHKEKLQSGTKLRKSTVQVRQPTIMGIDVNTLAEPESAISVDISGWLPLHPPHPTTHNLTPSRHQHCLHRSISHGPRRPLDQTVIQVC